MPIQAYYLAHITFFKVKTPVSKH